MCTFRELKAHLTDISLHFDRCIGFEHLSQQTGVSLVGSQTLPWPIHRGLGGKMFFHVSLNMLKCSFPIQDLYQQS